MKNKQLIKKKGNNNKKKELFQLVNLQDKIKNKENLHQIKDKIFLLLIKLKGNQMKNYHKQKNQYLNNK